MKMPEKRPTVFEYVLGKIVGYGMEFGGIAAVVYGVAHDNAFIGTAFGFGLYTGGKLFGDELNIRANLNVPDISDKLNNTDPSK